MISKKSKRTEGRVGSAFLGISCVLALTACGSTQEPAAVPESTNLADTVYEPLPTFDARTLLADDLLSGELHDIEITVENDGYENRYTITSDFGTFVAHRTDYVPERVQEVYAMAELNKVTRSEAFAQGVAQAATSPFRALKNLATEPVDTVTGVFRGVGALFSQAGEMVSGTRGELEESAAKELVGFGEIKREIAELLEIDPYTTNPILQQGMNDVAWAGFAGGLSLAPLTAQVGGGVGTALSGLQNSQTLNSLLTSQSPEALRDLNRNTLERLGAPDDSIDIFINHPWLSPRHETVIVAALAGMEGTANHAAFLEQVVVSESEQQSIFLMRQAEAILGFHQNVAPVGRLERVNRIVLLHTIDERAVMVLPADHLLWSLGASLIADQTVSPRLKRELWLTGSISARAKAEFERRGWRVMADRADDLTPVMDSALLEQDSDPEAQE
jgi:hypothetical protein